MRLTEELLKALTQLGATANHEEQIIGNNMRLEARQDEYSYLMEIAKEQIEALNQEGGIFTICSELIGHLVRTGDSQWIGKHAGAEQSRVRRARGLVLQVQRRAAE